MRTRTWFGGVAIAGLLLVAARWMAAALAQPAPVAEVVPAAPLAVSPAPPTVQPVIHTRSTAVDPGPVTITVEDVRFAQADPSPAGTAALVASLDADDRIVASEAADGLVARGAVTAIPALRAIDVSARPDIAPGIIDALGRLGAMADGDLRIDAVTRLLELLEVEKHRRAPESAGNLVMIYEALGKTRDQRAAPRLEIELADPTLAKAPKVVVVQALAAIGAPSSRAAIARLREQLGAATEVDPYQAELRRDLLAVIDAALAAP